MLANKISSNLFHNQSMEWSKKERVKSLSSPLPFSILLRQVTHSDGIYTYAYESSRNEECLACSQKARNISLSRCIYQFYVKPKLTIYCIMKYYSKFSPYCCNCSDYAQRLTARLHSEFYKFLMLFVSLSVNFCLQEPKIARVHRSAYQ